MCVVVVVVGCVEESKGGGGEKEKVVCGVELSLKMEEPATV